MAQTPDMSEVIEDAVEAGLESVYTSLPGEVVSYNASKQSVDVSPLIVRGEEGEDGEVVWRPIPVLPSLPVVFPGAGSGGNAYRTTWPINKGDLVLIIFTNYDLGVWKTKGGKTQVPPGRGRVKDAFVLAGAHHFGSPPTTPSSDAMVLTVPTGKQIRLGSSGASEAVVVESALDDYMTALTNASNALQLAGGSSLIAKLAVEAIKNALLALNLGDGWIARTSKTKAE